MKQKAEIVLDGERVEGYELPPNPREDERQQHIMRDDCARRAESERTMFQRGLRRVADDLKGRRGRGIEWSIPHVGTFEARVLERSGGRLYVLELYRIGVWSWSTEFWKGGAR